MAPGGGIDISLAPGPRGQPGGRRGPLRVVVVQPLDAARLPPAACASPHPPDLVLRVVPGGERAVVGAKARPDRRGTCSWPARSAAALALPGGGEGAVLRVALFAAAGGEEGGMVDLGAGAVPLDGGWAGGGVEGGGAGSGDAAQPPAASWERTVCVALDAGRAARGGPPPTVRLRVTLATADPAPRHGDDSGDASAATPAPPPPPGSAADWLAGGVLRVGVGGGGEEGGQAAQLARPGAVGGWVVGAGEGRKGWRRGLGARGAPAARMAAPPHPTPSPPLSAAGVGLRPGPGVAATHSGPPEHCSSRQRCDRPRHPPGGFRLRLALGSGRRRPPDIQPPRRRVARGDARTPVGPHLGRAGSPPGGHLSPARRPTGGSAHRHAGRELGAPG